MFHLSISDFVYPTVSPWVRLRLSWKHSLLPHIQLELNSINRVFQLLNILHGILVDLVLSLYKILQSILKSPLMWGSIRNRVREPLRWWQCIILMSLTKIGVIPPPRIICLRIWSIKRLFVSVHGICLIMQYFFKS
jgi:hypothetical protein